MFGGLPNISFGGAWKKISRRRKPFMNWGANFYQNKGFFLQLLNIEMPCTTDYITQL